jgi:hypothetical protein
MELIDDRGLVEQVRPLSPFCSLFHTVFFFFFFFFFHFFHFSLKSGWVVLRQWKFLFLLPHHNHWVVRQVLSVVVNRLVDLPLRPTRHRLVAQQERQTAAAVWCRLMAC